MTTSTFTTAPSRNRAAYANIALWTCLLYTSDAADDM
jgi:hypothetical protein